MPTNIKIVRSIICFAVLCGAVSSGIYLQDKKMVIIGAEKTVDSAGIMLFVLALIELKTIHSAMNQTIPMCCRFDPPRPIAKYLKIKVIK
jgi:hypothetical protein